MSVIRSSGLLGVSIQSSAVGLARAALTAAEIAEIDELDLPLAAAPPGVEQPISAAIAVVGRHDARAAPE